MPILETCALRKEFGKLVAVHGLDLLVMVGFAGAMVVVGGFAFRRMRL